MACEHCENTDCAASGTIWHELLQYACDGCITTEYFRRLRAHKAKLTADGGKSGGWPKGKPRMAQRKKSKGPAPDDWIKRYRASDGTDH